MEDAKLWKERALRAEETLKLRKHYAGAWVTLRDGENEISFPVHHDPAVDGLIGDHFVRLINERDRWMEEAEKWKKDRGYWRQRALSAEDALGEEQVVVEDICDSTNRELARLRGERDKYFTRLKETLNDFYELQEEHDALVSRCGHEFGTSDPDRIKFLMAEHDNELDRAGRRFEILWAALITERSNDLPDEVRRAMDRALEVPMGESEKVKRYRAALEKIASLPPPRDLVISLEAVIAREALS